MIEQYLKVPKSNLYILPMRALLASDLKVGLHICVINNQLKDEERARRAEQFNVAHPPFMHEDAKTIDSYIIAETIANPDTDSGIPGINATRMLPLSYLGISLDSSRNAYGRERYSVSYATLLAFKEAV